MADIEFDLSRMSSVAFEALPQGILITDTYQASNPIIYANPAFARLTGYGTEEVLGQNCRFLQGARTDPAEVERIRGAIAGRRFYRGLILNYRKDGTEFWNDLTIGPITSAEQSDRYLVGVQLDATPQLELEQRLRESQKMEALGKLTGGIAHDFNNLLALILGNAEVIAGRCEQGTLVGDAAADIVEAALAGSNLVKRMLDFSRGRPRSVERVAVNALVSNVIALVGRSMSDDIAIREDLDAAPMHVMADRTLFETGLLNLALNARDAMPDGGTLTFATRTCAGALAEGAEAVSIVVADTGSGMDEETRRRAFEPYYSTKGPERGTGLGLSMVYSFAEQTGGQALIKSQPARGTSVELLLPAAPPSGAGEAETL